MVYKKKKKQKKIEKPTVLKCCAMGCSNKKTMNGKPVHFFRVPEGIEGFFWAKAVNRKRKNYEQVIDLLSSSVSIEKNPISQSSNIEYCCEVHFNIETELVKIIGENGSVEYKIKPGVFPTIESRQTKWLWEIEGLPADFVETFETETNEINNSEHFTTNSNSTDYLEILECKPEKESISIVDISTLSYQKPINDTQRDIPSQQCDMVINSYNQPDDTDTNNLYDQSVQVKHEPIMPLIVDLMKRKSFFYMGLQSSSLTSLLQITTSSTKLTEPQIMLTLRKLRLNEDFEVLGDLFDIDKRTAEKYFEECSILITDAMRNLNGNTNNIVDTSEPMIKVEPCEVAENPLMIEEMVFHNSYECNNEIKGDEQDEYATSYVTSTGSPSSGSEFDPDFDSDGYESSASSEYSKSSETFPCPLCPRFVHHLDNHINKFHSSPLNVNKTICGLCMKTFENKVMLRAHQSDCHNGHAFSCDICKSMFTNYSDMKQHIVRKHSKLKLHLCDICGAGYGEQCKLKDHMERKHLMIRKHPCHLCDKKFFTTASCKLHIYSRHTGERPFQCEVKGCGKSFWAKSYLSDHQNVHAQPKFTCEICAKKFSYKQNMTTHKKNIHGLV